MANFKVLKYLGAKIFDCYNNFSNAIIFQILSDSNHEGFRQRTDILRIIQIFEYEWDCLHLKQLMENRGISHQNDKNVPKSSQTILKPKNSVPQTTGIFLIWPKCLSFGSSPWKCFSCGKSNGVLKRKKVCKILTQILTKVKECFEEKEFVKFWPKFWQSASGSFPLGGIF